MQGYTAHVDTFARDNLPPRDQWPAMVFDLPELRYPDRLNCGVELLDRVVAAGHGGRRCLITPAETWTYARLMAEANRIAHVLTEDMGVVPGSRVLLRSANNPMMVACWFAVMKAGAIAVATMPLLRARELAVMIEKARVEFALCDARLAAELEAARPAAPTLRTIRYFNGEAPEAREARSAPAGLEALARSKPDTFTAVDTAAEDVCLIAFTSGTTGVPKGTMHFHRDVLAICDCFPKYVLKPSPDDIFCGSPPLAFTFGLGGLVTFPMRIGAATVLLEKATPDALLAQAIQEHRASICFTSPTGFRAMLRLLPEHDASSLRCCVSAGETLPLPTWQAFKDATGIGIIDGLGATEMLHIFISAAGDDIRPGATGRPIPGYQACILDEHDAPLPPNHVGRLAVRGPTGCRYLADHRQSSYVRNGWNITGDAYLMDQDGYFWYQARTDEMIISSGYNIAGPEVEEALLAHPDVQECAVVGVPDADRGQIVKAFVVLRPGTSADATTVKALQDFAKQQIAPYKYPRAIAFMEALPRTESGKVQRFRLRELQEPERKAS
ncbi:AMP-binding protein [Arenibaculum pallidiluteum]|uniref:AMP-binding protein n=1 Tax=Arenibaculum pallidiluteum TaxID=2812559 RepID=UPI001A959AE2|nr:AMP-binding protein [Arenibaculum pallidiluteum]